jgi:hypothetical protein
MSIISMNSLIVIALHFKHATLQFLPDKHDRMSQPVMFRFTVSLLCTLPCWSDLETVLTGETCLINHPPTFSLHSAAKVSPVRVLENYLNRSSRMNIDVLDYKIAPLLSYTHLSFIFRLKYPEVLDPYPNLCTNVPKLHVT